MKLLATTAAVSVFAFAVHASTINGCEVALIEGTNAYQFVDPTCAPFNGGGASDPSYAQPVAASPAPFNPPADAIAAIQKASEARRQDRIDFINSLRH